MKLLWCLAFLVISVSSKAIDNDTDSAKEHEHKKDRIVGGRPAEIETLPYQAQLLQNGQQICGATIINEQWLLSAAHCFTESSPKWSIITGSSEVSKGGHHHEIAKQILHPGYDSDEHDIALIKLAKPIVFNEYQKAIPLASSVPKTGDKMTVSGFGKLGQGRSFAKELQVANVPVLDHKTCEERYKMDTITDNMFCAGEGPTDTCQGDSGGPGVINGELVGVVSSGMKCGDKYFPGIYTTVYNYLDWIDKYAGTKKSSYKKFKIPIVSDVLDIVFNRHDSVRA